MPNLEEIKLTGGSERVYYKEKKAKIFEILKKIKENNSLKHDPDGDCRFLRFPEEWKQELEDLYKYITQLKNIAQDLVEANENIRTDAHKINDAIDNKENNIENLERQVENLVDEISAIRRNIKKEKYNLERFKESL